MAHVLGIDIGGTGIKARAGGPRARERCSPSGSSSIPRARPRPTAVIDVVRQLVTGFGWNGPAGITFPGVVIDGVIRTAANVDQSWIGIDARDRVREGDRPGPSA